MNINRNNYEHLFLLYVDGELTPQEMLELDAFCEKHPDLAEELQLLMDTKLDSPAAIEFPEKNTLLKPELWDAENLEPWQQAMLSQLDDETISAEEKNSIAAQTSHHQEWAILHHTQLAGPAAAAPHKHTLIKAQPWDAENLSPIQLQMLAALETGKDLPTEWLSDAELHKDWLLLQQSLLQPEWVAMPGKQKLYRPAILPKATVLKMGWMRIAAAAAVTVGIGWLLLNFLSSTTPVQNGNKPAELAQQPTQQVPGTQTTTKENDSLKEPGTTPPVVKDLPQYAAVLDGKTNAQPSAKETKVEREITLQEEKPAAQEIAYEERARLIAANRLSPEETEKLMNAKGNDIHNIQPPPDTRAVTNTMATMAAQDANSNTMKVEYAIASPAAEAEDNYVSIGGIQVQKQKLRGVFRTVTRKVTRGFDKSTVAPASEMK